MMSETLINDVEYKWLKGPVTEQSKESFWGIIKRVSGMDKGNVVVLNMMHKVVYVHGSNKNFNVSSLAPSAPRALGSALNAPNANRRLDYDPNKANAAGANQARFLEMTRNEPSRGDADRVIPMEEMAKHRKLTDCWVGYNGKVYDVTRYLTYHPGGRKVILAVGGKDCTPEFAEYHTWVNGERILENCLVGRMDPRAVRTKSEVKIAGRGKKGQEQEIQQQVAQQPPQVISFAIPTFGSENVQLPTVAGDDGSDELDLD